MNNSRPVTPNMKVGEVLKEHPELLDVLVAQSPEFKRLKNPVLRRIHGRLVTLAQAAAVAGLDPATLVRNLNGALGQETPEQSSYRLPTMAGTPPPPWLGSARVSVELDVREHQRRHDDPFAVIMANAAKVKVGEVLLLRNTFEPLPLYDVLGKRGFVAWARENGPQDWEVYFLKLDQPPSNTGAGASSTAEIEGETEPTPALAIDVRELTPPQPLLRILDALDQLKPGETLLVHHARRPVHLYPKLAELGCKQRTVERGPGRVDIYIRKRETTFPENSAGGAPGRPSYPP